MMEVAGKNWVFLAGHHPYRSNGTLGNAGDYDAPELAGVPIPNPLPIQDDQAMKAFFDDHMCGLGQVYFADHDHSRQWINEPARCVACSRSSRALARARPASSIRGNTALYEDSTETGFCTSTSTTPRSTGSFYDREGNLGYTHSFTK